MDKTVFFKVPLFTRVFQNWAPAILMPGLEPRYAGIVKLNWNNKTWIIKMMTGKTRTRGKD